MQAKAILEAAVNVAKRGVKPLPHIMVPLVGFEEELAHQVGGQMAVWLTGWRGDLRVGTRGWSCAAASATAAASDAPTPPSLPPCLPASRQIRVIRAAAADVFKAAGTSVEYKVGGWAGE